MIAKCKDEIARPSEYDSAIYAGYGWAYAGASCAAAWQITKDTTFVAPGLRMFGALLDDNHKVGDGAGGVPGAVSFDSGYPIRYFGAFVALLYDWYHDAPGVDAYLTRAQDRMKGWVAWYDAHGYLKSAGGSNYEAGYLFAKTLIGIAALGEDDGSAASFWSDVVDMKFPKEIIGTALAPKGPLASGDWAEGWEYGALGSLEYALAARAIEEQGVALPPLHAWADALAVHYHYALLPDKTGFFTNGDWGTSSTWPTPSAEPLLAVLAGPGSDEAASWAAAMRKVISETDANLIYDALAEARPAAPVDFTSSPRSLFYVTAGTRKLYARSSWQPDAFWGAIMSAPKFALDHQHLDASNIAFARGGDALIVDPSPYGSLSTLTGNAVTVDSQTVQSDYRPSQSPYTAADLVWARGVASGIAAARADIAAAFQDSNQQSDVPYARRDWVFLPEGEIVTLDRTRTDSASRSTYLRFRSAAPLAAMGAESWGGKTGSSQVVIHQVALSGGTPEVRSIAGGATSCDGVPLGMCDTARFAVTELRVTVPGPSALAVHVVDGLATNDSAAEALAMGDLDPSNRAVVGASVKRGGVRTFVVASSAKDGIAGSSLGYAVPGDSATRHVVFDAPEDSNGESQVKAAAADGRCTITITAGSGFAGRPLIFGVAGAQNGCVVTEDSPVGVPSGDGGAGSGGSGGVGNSVDGGSVGNGGPNNADDNAGAGGDNSSSGCGCRAPRGTGAAGATAILALGAAVAGMRRLRRRASRVREWP
jgi:hypothetical protein